MASTNLLAADVLAAEVLAAEPKEDTKHYNILTLDGGAIKGIITA
jgi:hypothetical protein